MKKTLFTTFSAVVCFLLSLNNWGTAQVANYVFTETTGAYVPIITDGTLGTGGGTTGTWSGTISSSSTNRLTLTLPFPMCLGGNTFAQGSTLTMHHNGWAAFGDQTPNAANRVAPLTSLNNVMSAFGTDLVTAGSCTYGARVVGSSPFRVLVLQWGHHNLTTFWKRLDGGSHSNDRLIFQIRLYESTGVIEFHYLISEASNNNGGTMTSNIHVGLTGNSAGDFNVRTKSGNTIWNGNHSAGSARPSGTTNTMNFNNRRGQSPSQLIKPNGTILTTATGTNSGTGTATIFRWSPPVSGTWDNPASWVNCYNPLAVTLDKFTGVAEKRSNKLEWETATEINNDYFIVETSANGVDWNELDRVNGMGTTTQRNSYELYHQNPEATQYYRLKQIDFDGTKTNYGPIVIERKAVHAIIVRTTNLIGQDVNENYKGIVLLHYSDGTTVKVYQ